MTFLLVSCKVLFYYKEVNIQLQKSEFTSNFIFMEQEAFIISSFRKGRQISSDCLVSILVVTRMICGPCQKLARTQNLKIRFKLGQNLALKLDKNFTDQADDPLFASSRFQAHALGRYF